MSGAVCQGQNCQALAGGIKIIYSSGKRGAGITAFNPLDLRFVSALSPSFQVLLLGFFLVHLISCWEFSDDVITLVGRMRAGALGLSVVAICRSLGGLHRSAEEEEEEEGRSYGVACCTDSGATSADSRTVTSQQITHFLLTFCLNFSPPSDLSSPSTDVGAAGLG